MTHSCACVCPFLITLRCNPGAFHLEFLAPVYVRPRKLQKPDLIVALERRYDRFVSCPFLASQRREAVELTLTHSRTATRILSSLRSEGRLSCYVATSLLTLAQAFANARRVKKIRQSWYHHPLLYDRTMCS